MSEIRPFRPEDRDAIVAIGNRDRPPYRQHTAAAWARNDDRRKPEEVFLRLCVGHPETDQAIAMLDIVDLNTTGFKLKDVCAFEIVVNHEDRGRGIGGMPV